MNHQTGGLGGRVVAYFHADKLYGHHNGMEDVSQVCGNRSSPSSSPPLPFPPLRSKAPLLQVGGLGSPFAPLAGPGRARPPHGTGEFQAENLASGSNNLQELFRK